MRLLNQDYKILVCFRFNVVSLSYSLLFSFRFSIFTLWEKIKTKNTQMVNWKYTQYNFRHFLLFCVNCYAVQNFTQFEMFNVQNKSVRRALLRTKFSGLKSNCMLNASCYPVAVETAFIDGRSYWTGEIGVNLTRFDGILSILATSMFQPN